MLKNGLGRVLGSMVGQHNRFIDLFSGSASVAWHVAQRYALETRAYDLQVYSAALASAVIQRNYPVDPDKIWRTWSRRASALVDNLSPPINSEITVASVERARSWAGQFERTSLINAYGGHYYSPIQVSWIQALRDSIPDRSDNRDVCLAALIMAASKCAAAPGHTAQPFQPTRSAIEYLRLSWRRNLSADVHSALTNLAPRYAKVPGKAHVMDANLAAKELLSGDLVFIDPPYSSVQYSRFYHVLEAIAVGSTSPVFGVGRYPPLNERPSSEYSKRKTSLAAIEDLLTSIAERDVSAIITFPNHECSNGIDASAIEIAAGRLFKVTTHNVASVFSTLGGPSLNIGNPRKARLNADEVILCLEPR